MRTYPLQAKPLPLSKYILLLKKCVFPEILAVILEIFNVDILLCLLVLAYERIRKPHLIVLLTENVENKKSHHSKSISKKHDDHSQ